MISTEPETLANERSLLFLRTMLANKRAEQQKMIDEFNSDPAKQAIFAELRRKNALKKQAASRV